MRGAQTRYGSDHRDTGNGIWWGQTQRQNTLKKQRYEIHKRIIKKSEKHVQHKHKTKQGCTSGPNTKKKRKKQTNKSTTAETTQRKNTTLRCNENIIQNS